MRFPARIIALCVCVSLTAYGQENSFDRVRYNGGSVHSKIDPKDWKNTLTVTSDIITLSLKDGKKVEIPPKSVTSLSYGQEAHRRVGTMIALAILGAPVPLFGMLPKTRLHYIGIQYTDASNKSAGILLQGDKDNYRTILVALQGVTNVPVSVSKKDREFVPVGVKSEIAKDNYSERADAKPATQTAEVKGVVDITSTPDGADVLLDGNFIGNAPATLALAPGKHTITVKMSGRKDWTREISVEAASEVQLSATLEPTQ
ncbi:MAG TPA: PEGA domain-containing protein [Candidatus Acidoferrum sp.]|nr:PEGA domain-containing protein [Candidatus Acidoferrum sp.]